MLGTKVPTPTIRHPEGEPARLSHPMIYSVALLLVIFAAIIGISSARALRQIYDVARRQAAER
jgi:hypothetical protein